MTFNGLIEGTDEPPRLSEEHKIATILSLIPAAPNDSRQLYPVIVYPADVADLLPTEMAESLISAEGPQMEIRVGHNVERARVAWKDDRYRDIEALFGVGGAKDQVPRIGDLIVNLDSEGAARSNAASINAIARAVAARAYARYADRYMGSAATHMKPGVEPRGWATEATYSMSPRGEMTTSLSFAEEQEALDFLSILDPQSRSVILREVTGAG